MSTENSTTPSDETTHDQLLQEYNAGKYGDMPAWAARKQSLKELGWRVLKRVATKVNFVNDCDTIDSLALRLAKKGYYNNDETKIVYQYNQETESSERIFI